MVLLKSFFQKIFLACPMIKLLEKKFLKMAFRSFMNTADAFRPLIKVLFVTMMDR